VFFDLYSIIRARYVVVLPATKCATICNQASMSSKDPRSVEHFLLPAQLGSEKRQYNGCYCWCQRSDLSSSFLLEEDTVL